jgi:hypothetical protein
MATLAWATLYAEALQSEPEDLPDRIYDATESIVERMRKIGAAGSALHSSEYCALCVALSDMRTLRISDSHRRWRKAPFPC